MTNRESIVCVRFTPEELAILHEKMERIGTTNLSAFIRKLCMVGYVI